MSAFRSMSIPRPVHSRVARNATSMAAKRGVKRRVNTGAMFDHALLGLHQPGSETRPDRAARQQPRLEEGLDIDPDGLEDYPHGRDGDAAAEGDQHVVDEQLAGEPDEVHAARHFAPPVAGVRDAHYQPERDRQVQRRKRLGELPWANG